MASRPSLRLPGVILVWALAWVACARPPDPEAMMSATATSRPTPTLAAGAMPAAPPTPAVTTDNSTALVPTVAVTPQSRTPGVAAANTTPTATPLPADRVVLGRAALDEQDYTLAAELFRGALAAADTLSAGEVAEARFGLAEAYWGEDRDDQARAAYLDFVEADGAPAGQSDRPIVARYRLATLAADAGDCREALVQYDALLELAPGLAAYARPWMAACHLALGDRDAALAAYEAAVAAPAHPLQTISLRQVLAARYLEDGNLEAAIAQYDAIHALAESELTRAQVTVAAGNALVAAGDLAAGQERYLFAVDNYPRAYDSYQALIALVNAGIEVDEFQRGLIDYYAGAYFPGIEAFARYLADAGDAARPEAHLFLAWCYEAVGELDAARAEMAAYTALEPVAGRTEAARLEERAGNLASAIAAYGDLAEAFPDDPAAADAAWRAAVLVEDVADADPGLAYRRAAEAFPAADWAAEAWFRSGWHAWLDGDEDEALARWSEGAGHTDRTYGAASLLWLLRELPVGSEERALARETAAGLAGDSYYAFRARMVAAGEPAFAPAGALDLVGDEAAALVAAEAWLADWWGQSGDLSSLSPALAGDGRWDRGRLLWQMGLYREADRELAGLREAAADDPVASYRLALAFRDAGMFRESILAAAVVRGLSGQPTLALPRHLAQLLYPAYYAERITALGAQYDYDPLLQFSLVRQESLFNSFATSVAAAQGLSQVIPDTGLYIAQKLAWPEYENEDLYRPYVGLAFGAFYLQEQLATFNGQVHAALAAYNAGPGNAARWIRQAPDDLDLFVEIIDFPETRLYVERIYAGYEIYRWLYAVP